jgi:acylphosphatase
VRAHAVISGRVQGVGFRYFTARRARRLGLAGFVRNLPDGRVEVEALGDPGVLQEFVAALRQGPPGASVRDVTVDWQEASGDAPPGREFEVR